MYQWQNLANLLAIVEGRLMPYEFDQTLILSQGRIFGHPLSSGSQGDVEKGSFSDLRLDVPCLLVCTTAPGSLVICPDQPYRVTSPDRRPESVVPLTGMVKGCFDTQVPSLGGPGSFTNAPMPS